MLSQNEVAATYVASGMAASCRRRGALLCGSLGCGNTGTPTNWRSDLEASAGPGACDTIPRRASCSLGNRVLLAGVIGHEYSVQVTSELASEISNPQLNPTPEGRGGALRQLSRRRGLAARWAS